MQAIPILSATALTAAHQLVRLVIDVHLIALDYGFLAFTTLNRSLVVDILNVTAPINVDGASLVVIAVAHRS